MSVEAFFAFMQERENVRLRKEAGDFFPWTDDPILREYKFTNVHRHHDKTSRVLRETFYTPHFEDNPKNILLNAAIFRYFGTYEFAEAVGWQNAYSVDWERIRDLAETRLANKERVFTGAYVITNGGISDKKQNVVIDHYLKGLQSQIVPIVELAHESDSWEQTGRKLMNLEGFGGSGFMTKEVLLDTTYTAFWKNRLVTKDDGAFTFPIDWWSWTPVGPGARRGAARVLGYTDQRSFNEETSATLIAELVLESRERWPKEWDALCPHDIQFQLCEFDKYERTRLDQGRPRSRYKP